MHTLMSSDDQYDGTKRGTQIKIETIQIVDNDIKKYWKLPPL